MKKPFLANFEVNLEDNKPNKEIEWEVTIITKSLEHSDPDFFICGFTQRTRSSEDSDTDESII